MSLELIGVYHAKGTLLGELTYVVGKLLGRAHCALCDITHRGLSEKPAVVRWRTTAPWPVRWVHLDEQPEAVAQFTAGRTPCVVAVREGAYTMLLDTDALKACGGSEERFFARIRDAIDTLPPL